MQANDDALRFGDSLRAAMEKLNAKPERPDRIDILWRYDACQNDIIPWFCVMANASYNQKLGAEERD
jgi:hypothetical protein